MGHVDPRVDHGDDHIRIARSHLPGRLHVDGWEVIHVGVLWVIWLEVLLVDGANEGALDNGRLGPQRIQCALAAALVRAILELGRVPLPSRDSMLVF